MNQGVQVILIDLLAAALALPHESLESRVLFFESCDVSVACGILMLEPIQLILDSVLVLVKLYFGRDQFVQDFGCFFDELGRQIVHARSHCVSL